MLAGNLKLNKNKCYFTCIRISFFVKIISRNVVHPDLRNTVHAIQNATPTKKKELQSFWSIMKCLGKFSPETIVVWATEKIHIIRKGVDRNSTYPHLYDTAKAIIKKDASVAFYNKKEQPYLETDAFGMGLGWRKSSAKGGTECGSQETKHPGQ